MAIARRLPKNSWLLLIITIHLIFRSNKILVSHKTRRAVHYIFFLVVPPQKKDAVSIAAKN